MKYRVKGLLCGVFFAVLLTAGVAFAEEMPPQFPESVGDGVALEVDKQPALQEDAQGVVEPPAILAEGLEGDEDVEVAPEEILAEDIFSDEVLRDVVVDAFDSDRDGLLSDVEIASATNLAISGKTIGSFAGLEKLTGLVELSFVDCQLPTNASLASPSLKVVTMSGCTGLAFLDVSGCSALEKLDCTGNAIGSLAFPAQLLKECSFGSQVSTDGSFRFAGWSLVQGESPSEVIADFKIGDADYDQRAAAIAGNTVYAVWASRDFSQGTWEEDTGKWRFAIDGEYIKNCKAEINGKTYFFDAEGLMCSGWKKHEGEWYYLGDPDEGAAYSGWLKWGNTWYYLDRETKTMARGWRDLGSKYYFGEGEDDGKMASSWRFIDGDWYYFGGANDGIMKTGWLYWGGVWRFLGADGAMRTGWVYDNAWYYLDPANDGIMETGWLKDDGKWYFLNDAGIMQYGWVRNDGKWYYLGVGGVMETGWQKHGSWYLFAEGDDGSMQTGWQLHEGDWYYLGSANDGAMKTGWVEVGGYWYYLNGSGIMQTGWLQQGDNWYYLWSWGGMATGMHTIDGKRYYFDASGIMRDLTADEQSMVSKAQGYSSSTNWLIMVDTTKNQLGIFYGSKGNWGLKYFWQCSTGAWATPTVLGQYQVTGKGYSFGSGFTCYYYTQFYGDYLIHSVTYYQNTFTVMEGKMGVNISHGCVRLPIDRAKWIYDNIPYWTKVVTYR